MNFLICVEVPAKGPMARLVQELQQAYDNGAYGNFRCIVTHQPSYMVLFERSAAEDDWGYLQDHMRIKGVDIEQASQIQLASELALGLDRESQTYMLEIIETLQNHDAQIVDFGGVLQPQTEPA